MSDITEGLEVYLVGGAVRDRLLGRTIKDRDWVVIGASPDQMSARGFLPVGRDFPVFLHPETKEEYALARTERKTAAGYQGFEFNTSPEVSLEQDLARRDLTINAIAQAPTGELIDPFRGVLDLEQRRLCHVTPAFAEDPVRILRVARFATRYAALGFTIAPETLALMRQLVDQGEVDALVPERVWTELNHALTEDRPSVFISSLRECGALARTFPQIDALFGVPQPEQHHPEIDCGLHTLLVVDAAAALSPDSTVRFAALVHDLGKALTPQEEWPNHRGHEERGIAPINELCELYRVPKAHRELALMVCRHHLTVHRIQELRSGSVARLLESLDLLRRPQRLEPFIHACHGDVRGRTGCEQRDYPQGEILRRCLDAARAIDIGDLIAQGLDGPVMAERIHQRRAEAITRVLAESKT